MKLALVFPGQGSQYVGMGRELASRYEAVARALAEADAALGEPLSRLCFEGPEEELRRTVNTQPAILAVSVAIYQLVAQLGWQPAFVAGHSLGEYTALVAAGALPFADAVRLVRLRGRLMEEAVPPGEGTMAAVLGLEAAQVEAACRQASQHGVVEPATYNGPGQVVIAGQVAAVEQALALCRQAGARRAVPLNVSGPFHSSLLAPAGQRLAPALAEVAWQPAQVPVVANVSARPLRDPGDIQAALVAQVYKPVLWEQSVRYMAEQGVNTFIEVGPGRVLSGLIRRILPDAEVLNVEDEASWQSLLAWAKGDGLR